MYDKKYRLDKIEEFNRHNPMYDDAEGKVCYLAYLYVGRRGLFLWQDNDHDYKIPHRVSTSVIENVEYADNKVIAITKNTKLTFVEIDD